MLFTILEILFFVAAAAFIGMVLGWVLRGLFSNEQAEISDLRASLRKLKKSQREGAPAPVKAQASAQATTSKAKMVKPVATAKLASAPKATKPSVKKAKPAVKPAVKTQVKPALKKAVAKKKPVSKTNAKGAVPVTKAERSAAQSAAKKEVANIVSRVGKAESKDDLTKIFGIGPKFESVLNGMGVSSYKQIAQFKKAEVRTVAAAIGSFSGRVERDDWVAGAKKVIKALKKKK